MNPSRMAGFMCFSQARSILFLYSVVAAPDARRMPKGGIGWSQSTSSCRVTVQPKSFVRASGGLTCFPKQLHAQTVYVWNDHLHRWVSKGVRYITFVQLFQSHGCFGFHQRHFDCCRWVSAISRADQPSPAGSDTADLDRSVRLAAARHDMSPHS